MIGSVLLALTLSAQAAQAEPPMPRRAESLYRANCQICHGPNGTGSPVMQGLAFKNRKWKHGGTQAAVVKTITNGVQGTVMQSFKDRLSPAEIGALAVLVRSFDPSMKPAPVKKR